jgi:hypothetical protein
VKIKDEIWRRETGDGRRGRDFGLWILNGKREEEMLNVEF